MPRDNEKIKKQHAEIMERNAREKRGLEEVERVMRENEEMSKRMEKKWAAERAEVKSNDDSVLGKRNKETQEARLDRERSEIFQKAEEKSKALKQKMNDIVNDPCVKPFVDYGTSKLKETLEDNIIYGAAGALISTRHPVAVAAGVTLSAGKYAWDKIHPDSPEINLIEDTTKARDKCDLSKEMHDYIENSVTTDIKEEHQNEHHD